MRKILTFFLTACIIFTFSFTGVFAETTTYADKAKAAVVNTINFEKYPACCTKELKTLADKFVDDASNASVDTDAEYNSLYTTFITEVKEFKTTAQQTELLTKLKTETIFKINSEKAAIKEKMYQNTTTFNTDFENYINYYIYMINQVTITDDNDYADSIGTINEYYNSVKDSSNFDTIIINLANVDKFVIYATNYAAVMKITKDINSNLTYNAATVDAKLAEVIIEIKSLAIKNQGEIETAMNECSTATTDANVALAKAKTAGIAAITTGEYDAKFWGTEVPVIQNEYITKINDASTTTITQVNTYVTTAKALIDKTKPVDKDKIITDLEKKVADLEKENTELKAKIDADTAIKTIIGNTSLKVTTKKVAKGIKVTVSGIDLGTDERYYVKYKFYRATAANGNYAIKKTKDSTVYINTAVTKNTKYYYKAIAVVYDEATGIEIGRTALADCKAGSRRG